MCCLCSIFLSVLIAGVKRPEHQCQYMRLFGRCNMRAQCVAMRHFSGAHICGKVLCKSLIKCEKLSDLRPSASFDSIVLLQCGKWPSGLVIRGLAGSSSACRPRRQTRTSNPHLGHFRYSTDRKTGAWRLTAASSSDGIDGVLQRHPLTYKGTATWNLRLMEQHRWME